MQQYLNMINHIRKQGLLVYSSRADKAELIKDIGEGNWNIIGAAQQFVFTGEPFVEHIDPSNFNIYETGFEEREDIDAPFPVFSIENLDGPLAITYLPADSPTLDWNSGKIVQTERKHQAEILTWCLVVKEFEPKKYGFFSYGERIETMDDGSKTSIFVTCKTNVDGNTVAHYLNRLNQEKLGAESVNCKVRIGDGKTKWDKKIRRIIHVAPKKYLKDPNPQHRKVDWTHRFEVRGHWVSLPGRMGKDREGNYCVKDWTWRANYIKGDEKLPLVKKTRVVEPLKEDPSVRE